MNLNEPAPGPALKAVAVLALILLTTASCSAIELYQDQSSAAANAAAGSASATADPKVSALEGALADARATEGALSTDATQAVATIAALESTPTNAPAAAALPAPASAETILYGNVPIDSDQLNIIAALAFDAGGHLLAATRAGEIYALPDRDGDGVADETRLIFADDAQQLSQVAGLIARGEALILLNGPRLSLLQDNDGDGVYEGVTHLAGGLPAIQSPLQASNGLVESPDGRLFTADIKSGEILQIVLRE